MYGASSLSAPSEQHTQPWQELYFQSLLSSTTKMYTMTRWHNIYVYHSTKGCWILEILPRLAACLFGQNKNANPWTPLLHRRDVPWCLLCQSGLFWLFLVIVALTCSAGGTGVLLNIEKVASQLEQLGADVQVRGLVDSGWFLESKQQKTQECPDSLSCTPVDAIKKGLR